MKALACVNFFIFLNLTFADPGIPLDKTSDCEKTIQYFEDLYAKGPYESFPPLRVVLCLDKKKYLAPFGLFPAEFGMNPANSFEFMSDTSGKGSTFMRTETNSLIIGNGSKYTIGFINGSMDTFGIDTPHMKEAYYGIDPFILAVIFSNFGEEWYFRWEYNNTPNPKYKVKTNLLFPDSGTSVTFANIKQNLTYEKATNFNSSAVVALLKCSNKDISDFKLKLKESNKRYYDITQDIKEIESLPVSALWTTQLTNKRILKDLKLKLYWEEQVKIKYQMYVDRC